MRVALVISSLWGGGAERVMSLLANQWAARGETVILVTYERSSSDYPLDPRIEHISLDMHRSSIGFFDALLNNWRRLVLLRRTLRAARPSVVISFEERMNAFVLLVMCGARVPCIISERTDPRQHEVGLVWAALRRLTYPLADGLVVQTEAVRPWARRAMLRESRVHVIPNPVRSMRHVQRHAARPSHPIVVGVGRLVEGKGFDILLRAFACIVQAHADLRMILVGDGPERGRLERLARELAVEDRLTITGWVAEPGETLVTADIYVLSSRYEGFPNALLEAMACGVPVVATRCAGASEILTHGRDGLLVSVGSVPELAGAMARLLADETLRERLGAQVRESAERYGIDAIVSKWDEVITSPHSGGRAFAQSSESQCRL